MNAQDLRKLYFSKKSNCCVCNRNLIDATGSGLGSVFVLDKDGNFYCTEHDDNFQSGDSRIFDTYKAELTTDEFNLLNKIATKTKMDCWFHLDNDEGGDYVYDLEEGEIIEIRDALSMLIEGIEDPENFFSCDFTIEEIVTLDCMCEEYSLNRLSDSVGLYNLLYSQHRASLKEWQYLLGFAQGFDGDIFDEPEYQQLQSLWTAFCLHNDLMVDTGIYDSRIREIWQIVGKGYRNGYEGFYNEMSKNLL